MQRIKSERDTALGYLRRTGPATAELIDKNNGKVYRFNFAAFADMSTFSMLDGREWLDNILLEDES